MKKTHKEKLNKNILKYLYLATFFLGIASAFVLYLESDYFKSGIGSENVMPFFLASYGLSLVLMLNWHRLVRRWGKANVFIYSLIVKMVVALALALMPISVLSVSLLVLYICLTVLNWLDMDNLLETCSVDKKTGKIRGLYLTIENFGYLVAPLASGYLISRFGFQAAFAASFVIMLIVLLISLTKFTQIGDCDIEENDFLGFLKKVFARRNVMKTYYISFLLEFFYALMIIYTPLYLLDLGFDWFAIGKIFTVMLIPFVLLQFPAGYLADTVFEEKNMMAIALAILGFSTILVFFIDSKSLLLWASVLFATRVGACLIEVLRDSYFYKRIDQRDVEIVDFFRTVRPMAYIIGAAVAAPIVAIFHIKLIFIIIGVAALTGMPVSLSLASSRIPPKIRPA